MKLIIIAAILLASLTSMAGGPNEKVLESFQKTFSNATDVTWQEHNQNFEASFHQYEVKLKVQYDASGNIVRTLRYYNVEVLPLYIQSKLQKKYADKKIYSVTELTTPEEISYHIILEDEKSWMNVHSDVFGNLSVEKKYLKA